MSIPQTIPAVAATAGTPTPVYTGAITAASTFIISKGVATITLNAASVPVGYHLGKQVTLWGFTTATYFNGEAVTVTSVNPALVQFTFNTTHSDVTLTSDAGNTAPAPIQKFRAVRVEADKGNTTHAIYVGDGSTSASRYTAELKYAGNQQFIWFGGDNVEGANIDASRIFIDTDSTGAKAQITLFY